MQTNKEVVVSGIRPTGFLHLGNYVGAIQNFIKLQEAYSCFFFVADWHSLTTHPDTNSLRASTHRVIAEYIASGIDPEKATIFVQSQIPEIAELYLILNTLSYKGELEKTVTFKEKIKLHAENINAGLLTYPVLQAADILIHRANKVPVGKDQEQHLEMARNFAERFNGRYGALFPSPEAFNFGTSLTKILSLDGKGKMSKSENAMTTIYLADDDALIKKKIMKSLTDSGPASPNSVKPPYIENLFTLLQLSAPKDVFDYFNTQYNTCSIRYGDLKKELAESMSAYIRPIRHQAAELLKDEAYLNRIIKQGAQKAQVSANATIQAVRKNMNLNY